MASTQRDSYPLYFTIVAALFLLVVNLGYLNLALHATPDFVYTGANPYTAADKLVYMSMVQQGREGLLFMKNVHTLDPQIGSMLSPHWFLIGQTANLFGLSNNAAYQIYRVVFIVLFLWLLYALLNKLFTTTFDKIFAALFVLFSGGLGWYVIMEHPIVAQTANTAVKFFYLPTDTYVTEGNTLLNFAQSPLFSVSQLLLILIVYLFIRHRDERSLWYDFINSALFAILVVMHPYDLPIVLTVLGSWAVWYFVRTKDFLIFKKYFVLLSGGFLALALNFFVVWSEPVLAEWLKQNLVFSPRFSRYLWGYGLLLPLTVIGWFAVWKTRRDHPWWVMLAFWSVLAWVLLYLPLNVNRRFINGLHIVLALMAYAGFSYLMTFIRHAWLRKIYVLAISLVVFSHLGFYFLVNGYFTDSVYVYGYYYLTADEQQVIAFLDRHSQRGARLLTSDEMTSFTLTSQLNRLVFKGHDHQTPHSHLKEQQVEWFFADQAAPHSLERKEAFLKGERVEFIILNHTRQKVPVSWLDEAAFLELVFANHTFSVYRVSG
ncbi:MAG: hypothetical protein AAB490_02135 [Patescibacteria group bacterium]